MLYLFKVQIGKTLYSLHVNNYNRYYPLYRLKRDTTAILLTLFRFQFVLNFVPAIDWSTVEVDGVDLNDWPKCCDAYYSYAEYTDGTPLTDEELDNLTEACPEGLQDGITDVYASACDAIYDAYKDGLY